MLTYPYSYSYESKIWYNSPGDSLIYNVNDLTLSNQVCNAACFIDANQTSKNITSSGGGKTDYITLSSPGPRSIDESDIIGEEYQKKIYILGDSYENV